jgi:L-methionine (R)-S-oxide reductase
MWSAHDLHDLPKPELYSALASQLSALIAGERDPIANLANTAALIFHMLPSLNWCGFYLLRDGELVVGPFQGRPACIRIALGSGVCGTAAATRRTLRVPDVAKFPGHIPCDSASRSEIVVPLIGTDDALIGVLDLDSPETDRFDAADEKGLESIVAIVATKLSR